MTRAADWADMATAVMAYVDAYGHDGALDALHVLDAYTAVRLSDAILERREPPDIVAEEFDLVEPAPGLTGRQVALVAALTMPRTSGELAVLLGWPSLTVGGVAASLARRGLVERVGGGLWSRCAP